MESLHSIICSLGANERKAPAVPAGLARILVTALLTAAPFGAMSPLRAEPGKSLLWRDTNSESPDFIGDCQSFTFEMFERDLLGKQNIPERQASNRIEAP